MASGNCHSARTRVPPVLPAASGAYFVVVMSGSPEAPAEADADADAEALAGGLAGADADGAGDCAPWHAANAIAALASRPNKRLCIKDPPKRVLPSHSHDQRPAPRRSGLFLVPGDPAAGPAADTGRMRTG